MDEKRNEIILFENQGVKLEVNLKDETVWLTQKQTAEDGKKYNVQYYNLDMIISIGYRVNSKQGILFRKWATNILKDYMLKGYAVNQKKLEYLKKL